MSIDICLHIRVTSGIRHSFTISCVVICRMGSLYDAEERRFGFWKLLFSV